MTIHLFLASAERRRAALFIGACSMLLAFPAWPQSAPKLRPSEAIPVPGGTVTVLGVEIRRGDTTHVTLRLRVTAEVKQDLPLYNLAFRLLAGGVPRAPENPPGGSIAADSARDLTCTFAIPDNTDDLVLQIRGGESIERRRLSGGP